MTSLSYVCLPYESVRVSLLRKRLILRAECLIICQKTMRTWWYICWMKAWQIEGRNLFWRMVLGFCWYSRTITITEANGFGLCQYNEHRVEAENSCACVLHIFQSLPLARVGWGMRKKEGPRLRSVPCRMFVCFFGGKGEVIEMMVLHTPEGVSLRR